MRTLIAVLLVAVCLPLIAQTPYLVKDINATGPNEILSSSPSNFVRFGSRVLFTTTTPAGGAALWSTNGTESGTQNIVGIGGHPDPFNFVPLNGKLLFDATDTSGRELWTTDGTASGTHRLADINPGLPSSTPGDRIVYHDQMIFAADDGIHGTELWITDGTLPGTRLIKDLIPGVAASFPHSFALFKDTVYFGAKGALWKSDGTESGTVKVLQSDATAGIDDLTVTAFGLFFTGFTQATGWAPWVSDGTESGTHPLAATAVAVSSTESSYAKAFRDRVLFIVSDAAHGRELWISDGTVAGTHIVRDINPGAGNSISTQWITVVGEHAFFLAYTPSSGGELWQTDGTEAGTTLVRDIAPGTSSSWPFSLVAAGEKVYFSTVPAGSVGSMLWVTDGTSTGTHPVKAPYPTIPGQFTSRSLFTNLDSVLYFSGANGVNGNEPWTSDGTDAGTSMIANLTPEATPSGDPVNLIAAGDWVYFDAWDGSTLYSTGGGPRSLWRSDGTSAGTLKLTDNPETPYGALGHSLLFNRSVVYENKFQPIWITNGTPEGTAPADDLAKLFPYQSYFTFLLGDKIFASTWVYQGSPYNSFSSELWAASTTSNTPAFSLGDSPGCMANLAGRLVFFNPYQSLFTTDGTQAGTYEVTTLSPYQVSCPTALNGNVFFAMRGSSAPDVKLWKTDGTFEGTTAVASLPSFAYLLTAAGRNLFLTSGGKLWVTDGTDAGTHALPATPSGSIFALGDRVVFQATDSVNGAELWTSDGTVTGTHIVADLYPGPTGSLPAEMRNIEGLVYFQANHDLLGNELWVTDGTAAGTKLVADLEPGSAGSSPKDFVQAGHQLFFSAITKAFGRELWAMPMDPTPSLTIDDVRVPEGDGGDVIARFTLTLSSPAPKNITVGFATENGTAAAGVDYDASSGTLTFAPGETTKGIDIHTHGNTIPENNRTFFLTLRNASGARLSKSSAFAVIEDDDQFADVALSLDFSPINANQVSAKVTNSGPRAATAIRVGTTATPSLGYTPCISCTVAPLTAGTSATAFTFNSLGSQRYLTATAAARQRDPQPSNNSVEWITNNSIAMDALYLTPGSQANVWFSVAAGASNVSVASSDSTIISVSGRSLDRNQQDWERSGARSPRRKG